MAGLTRRPAGVFGGCAEVCAAVIPTSAAAAAEVVAAAAFSSREGAALSFPLSLARTLPFRGVRRPPRESSLLDSLPRTDETMAKEKREREERRERSTAA